MVVSYKQKSNIICIYAGQVIDRNFFNVYILFLSLILLKQDMYMSTFSTSIAEQIWNMKYQLKDAD